jgi:hypothetical protein
MTLRVYTRTSAGRTVEAAHVATDNSPRVNGKIKLRPNKGDINLSRENSFRKNETGFWSLPVAKDVSAGNDGVFTLSTGSVNSDLWNKLQNRALAKFNGKLKKGSASLGVTLASWGQSQAMMISLLRRSLRCSSA